MREYTTVKFIGERKDEHGNLECPGYSRSKLLAASERKEASGKFNTTVLKTFDGFNVYGTAVMATASDLLNPTELNTRLAADLGSIQKVSGEDPFSVKGSPVDLLYVLNHGGMALAYGEAIKGQFKVSTKVSDVDTGKAIIWAQTNAPELLAKVAEPDGMANLIKAYQEAQTEA